MRFIVGGVVIMAKKYKAIKISAQGFLTNERDEPIVCPIRNSNCNLKCTWLSVEDRTVFCRELAIGALRPKPMQSFHLHTGPDVYNLDESLRSHEVESNS